ncbi:MAG: hypothetical protein OXH09_04865 [Gammaproteobacteria bacterium]|nr:hypothetical protein [Gammaproteobacteria bacterium]
MPTMSWKPFVPVVAAVIAWASHAQPPPSPFKVPQAMMGQYPADAVRALEVNQEPAIGWLPSMGECHADCAETAILGDKMVLVARDVEGNATLEALLEPPMRRDWRTLPHFDVVKDSGYYPILDDWFADSFPESGVIVLGSGRRSRTPEDALAASQMTDPRVVVASYRTTANGHLKFDLIGVHALRPEARPWATTPSQGAKQTLRPTNGERGNALIKYIPDERPTGCPDRETELISCACHDVVVEDPEYGTVVVGRLVLKVYRIEYYISMLGQCLVLFVDYSTEQEMLPPGTPCPC